MNNINKPDYDLLLKVSGKNLNKNLKKINKGYPIQYVIGNVNFFGYEIKVTKDVLIPRFETEQLVEETLKLLDKSKKNKVLDLGTGSGCISIALKKELPNSEITAIDKSSKALKIAGENAHNNEVEINFIKLDIKTKVPGTYDLIISNPPYISKQEKIMASVKKYEPKMALFAKNNGLYFYELIINNYKNSLTEKGIIALEIGNLQKTEIVKIIKTAMPKANYICKKDYSGKDRFIFIFNN